MGSSEREHKGLRVRLITYNGKLTGYHRAFGSDTPTVLFKGDELYIHAGQNGVMRTLAPLEHPIGALLESSQMMRTISVG